MFPQGLSAKLTRARPTSNIVFSAAAIAVVSEVNPDQPGASFFPSTLKLSQWQTLLLFLTLACSINTLFAAPAQQTIAAMNNAIYNNTLIRVTPMLFHHLELGMTYDAIVNTVGKSALYCDSGESYCNAANGFISKKCLEAEFTQNSKTWVCHWDGDHAGQNTAARLDVWFVGVRVSQISATMANGTVYLRDSGNTIQLEQQEIN